MRLIFAATAMAVLATAASAQPQIMPATHSKLAKTADQVAKVSDPLTGTWRQDVTQATVSGKPRTTPVGQADEWVQVSPIGPNGIMVDAEVTRPDGTKITERYSGQFDGKPMPVTGDGNAVTITMVRQDKNNMDRISRDKDGHVTVKRHMQVAPDGLSRTVHSEAFDPSGKKIRDSVSFFYRQ